MNTADHGQHEACELMAEPVRSLCMWPSTNALTLSRIQTHHSAVPLMRPPQAYHATYDTMPPQEQVLSMASTSLLLRMHYKSCEEQRTTGAKREPDEVIDESGRKMLSGNERPVKTLRSS